MDDLPIKPNQQYLAVLQQQRNSEKLIKPRTEYLRKSNPKYLPSATVAAKPQGVPQIQSKFQLTKAQLYQKIKSANQLKKLKYSEPPVFGQDNSKAIPQRAQSISKIGVPQQVSKPMWTPSIPQEAIKAASTLPTKEIEIQTQVVKKKYVRQEPTEKQKYENLLNLMNKQRQLFQKQKEEFKAQKDYLEFKKELGKVQGLPKPRSPPVKSKTITGDKTKKTSNAANVHKPPQEKLSANKLIHSASQQKQVVKPTSKLTQVQQKQKQFKNQIEASLKLVAAVSKQVQILSEARPSHDIDKLLEQEQTGGKFCFQDIHKIPNFGIECINRNIAVSDLGHMGNRYFLEYSKNYKGWKLVKRVKQSNRLIHTYQNGVTQIQHPNNFKTIVFPNDLYKLTIFSNSDVKQELPGPILSYYCKAKRVNRINFNREFQIYYYYDLQQVQIHYHKLNKKEILYKNGRLGKMPLQSTHPR